MLIADSEQRMQAVADGEKQLVQAKVATPDAETMMGVLGNQDANARLIERELGCRVVPGEGAVCVSGTDPAKVEAVAQLVQRLVTVAEQGHPVGHADVGYLIGLVKEGEKAAKTTGVLTDVVLVSDRGKKVVPRTVGQHEYVQAMRRSDLVFAIGPAGTGKTYLAMAVAVAALKAKRVARIILARPAVEAGERLGFLPGDLQEKVDPYLRPLYDALYDMMDLEKAQRYIDRRIIEVAPLAYMRGRTLNDSFIILDEAQNTTPAQMKMFLTRMGFGSKTVVTGDVTQTDLPQGRASGLNEAREILRGIPEIEFVHLTDRDVVRHRLVQHIIKAYESQSSPEPAGEPMSETE